MLHVINIISKALNPQEKHSFVCLELNVVFFFCLFEQLAVSVRRVNLCVPIAFCTYTEVEKYRTTFNMAL